jgi:hypothetical protein
MKNHLLLPVILFLNLHLGLFCYLTAQNIQQLDKKKGFKDIKIGNEIKPLLDSGRFEFKRSADNGYNIYQATDTTQKLGHIPILEFNLLTYQKKIHEIRLLLDFANFEQIKEILVKAYGEPNEKPCEELEIEAGKRIDCFWKGSSIFLWCSAVDYGDYKKSIIGFKDFKMVEKMKKELTQKALGDL